MKETLSAKGLPDDVRESLSRQAREASKRSPENRIAIMGVRDTLRSSTRDFDPEKECEVSATLELTVKGTPKSASTDPSETTTTKGQKGKKSKS